MYPERALAAILPQQEQIHANKLGVSMGLHYGTEGTPQTDSESWHRRLKRCF